MSTLTEQKIYMINNGFTEEEALKYVQLKAILEEEYNKCISTLKNLKSILSETEYKIMESKFNACMKRLNDGRTECEYKDLQTKVSWYSQYMNSFRIDIRKVFNKNIF